MRPRARRAGGASSYSHRPFRPASEPISSADRPRTVSGPWTTSWLTDPPACSTTRIRSAACGVRTRTPFCELRARKAAIEVSATRRPRPMTIKVFGGVLHLAHEVRGQEDRAPLGGQRPHQATNPLDALGVEPVDRFIEDQHVRVAEQGGRDAKPLP